MTMTRPGAALDTSLPTSAASDAWRARPSPILPKRPRYTGRMPAWGWFVVIGLCIAAALPVIRTSSVTESGAELRALEAERERLHSEIRSLAAHVGQLGSLARIQREAVSRFNMVPARPTIALDVPLPPPARTLPTRFLPAPDEVDAGLLDPPLEHSVWRATIDALVFD